MKILLAGSVATAAALLCCQSGFGSVPQTGPGRGFPAAAPWVSFYGSAAKMGDLTHVARTFRIINIDADPGLHGFTPQQIALLKAGGKNRVISYLNLGSTETFRVYWSRVPAGFVSGKDNRAAQRGAYEGYPDETWMDLGNAAYQHLMLDYVVPRLVAQGVDGFYLDNMEIVEHGSSDANGPCSPSGRQGGLGLVRRLRQKYPKLLIVMQNATGPITRLGKTGGFSFPSLLDGISHEEVYAPRDSPDAQRELKAWQHLKLRPGGRPFWIGTEDYVGGRASLSAAQAVYQKSRTQNFSPYITNASAGQQKVFYWPFE